eukprot:1181854-Prorocentrum_minimum.AAC.3
MHTRYAYIPIPRGKPRISQTCKPRANRTGAKTTWRLQSLCQFLGIKPLSIAPKLAVSSTGRGLAARSTFCYAT